MLVSHAHFDQVAFPADCVEAHYNMGLALKSLGNLRMAEKCFSKYNSIICGCPEALYQLATISLGRGDTGEAINRFTETLSIIPNDPSVCIELSNIFRFAGARFLSNLIFSLIIGPNHHHLTTLPPQ